jgi:hypothetical protein
MAQTLTTSFVTTSVPGGYNEIIVKSDPVGVAASGVIAIIGEADGGDHFSADDIKSNFFGPTQVDKVTQKYVSGPIVDAMRMLAAPSADADITGAPTRIYILKTNSSTKASAVVPSYGTISSKVAGIDGNKIKYEITQVDDEIAPEVSGNTIANFTALAGVQFAVRLNGGAALTIDVFRQTPFDYDTASEVIALVNAALPSGMSCVAGAATDSIKIMVDADLSANASGSGKAFELVEITPAGLTALGLDEGLYTSAVEPRIQVDVRRSDINLNESFLISSDIALSVAYQGSTATLTKTGSSLTTTVAGGSGANLSIDLSQYSTIRDLADFIASQTGYSASAATASAQSNPSVLDNVTAIGIATSNDELAGRIKRSISNWSRALASSTAVDSVVTASQGLPEETSSPIFLAGGTKGATLASDVATAIDRLDNVNVNFVVPLFSQNASEDIAEGLTDSSSTYTISAVNALVKNHCLKMSTAKRKKNRTAYLSHWGTFRAAKAEASSLSHYRISLVFQKVSQVDAFGEIKSFNPWMAAVNLAGMQAAGFYKGPVNKFSNIISYEDPADYQSNSVDDQEDALLSGLNPLTQDIVGNKWLSDQTTYSVDTNFTYNSSQLTYLADLVALDLTFSLQRAFVGKSLADVEASTVLGFLVSKMDNYKRQKLIAPSDDAPQAFKNMKVSISGPTVSVAVEIKPSSAIYFIPISLTLSQITQEAEV